MAILHQAELRPTKLELLSTWVPGQSWYVGQPDTPLESVGAYRFDDPAGEVGIETHLVRAGTGPILQVPLTYRGAPLEGAEQWLVGTMDHSVLGPRWAYDACGDPVYAATLAATILEGGTQAELYIDVDGHRETREPTVTVRGNGAPGNARAVDPARQVTCRTEDATTVIKASEIELEVRRRIDPADRTGDGFTLTGTWAGQDEPALLAVARPR